MNTGHSSISMLSVIFGSRKRMASYTEDYMVRRKEMDELRELTVGLEQEERRVRQELTLVDGFFAGVSQGLAIVTLDGVYHKVNEPYAKLLGVGVEDLVGVHAEDYWPKTDPYITDLLIKAKRDGFVDIMLLKEMRGILPPRLLVVSVSYIKNDGYGIVLEDQGRICERVGCPNRMPPEGR